MATLIPIFLNNVASTVQAGSSAIGSSSATGVNVAAGDGANFGTIGTNQFIPAVIVDASTSPETVKEFVWVTARSTDALTVVRQAEDSSRYAASTTSIQAGYTIAAVASKGALAAGAPIGPHPALNNLLGWTYDPVTAPLVTVAGGSGFIYLLAVYVAAPCTVSNLIIDVAIAGSGLTAALMGIYDGSGSRVGVTSDQSTAWASTGVISMPLTASAALTSGVYYVARLVSGTTTPQFRGTTTSDTPSANINSSTTRFRAGFLSGQSTLPSSVTLSSFGTTSAMILVGLS